MSGVAEAFPSTSHKFQSYLECPLPLTLGHNEVHIWCSDLSLAPPQLRLGSTLSADELRRANQFHFWRDRERFVAARGILRDILARYAGCPPAELRFSYSPFGKPYMASDSLAQSLRFNLSHSASLALYAVSWVREVGIDVERIDPKFADDEMAARFFSPAELAKLRSLPAISRPQAFFHCWTRKEAYVKARGQGLQIPLDSFEVSMAPDEPAAFLSKRESGWSLRALPVSRDYAAAVAARGAGWQIAWWQWDAPGDFSPPQPLERPTRREA